MPPIFEILVDAESNGLRIDSFLVRQFRNYNSWRMQRIVRAGGVTSNCVPVEQTDRVFAGQRLTVRLLEPPDKLLAPASMDLPVLFEDAWICVVNKPAGLVVHPVGETQTCTLANGLQARLDERTHRPGLLRPGIVHRLDRQTSGALVTAQTHQAHAALSTAFEQSRVSKTYLALVEGTVAADSGVMDWPIGRAPTGRHVLMSCRADALQRKPARTAYRVWHRFEDYTLVQARPRTGRNHQIRVHFAQLGHPLVGDEFYEALGKLKPFRNIGEDVRRDMETGLPIRRHALHAWRLEFAHPISQHWMQMCAPLPKDFRDTLSSLHKAT